MNLTKIENILKYILLVSIFSVPFIPFIVSGGLFFPFITGKAFVFRLLVELMVGVWAVLALINPKYRTKSSLILILTGIFILIIGLADILGKNPSKSIWSNFERMEGWVTLIHLFGYLVVVSAVLNTKKLWHKFFNVSIIASMGMVFYGILQLIGKLEIHQGSTRLDATLGNSSYLAVYLLINIFLAFYLLLRRKNWSLISYLYIIAISLQTFILYHTATRGAILGLIGGLIVTTLIIAIFEKERIKLKKVAIGGLAGLVLFVGLFVAFRNNRLIQDNSVLKRFADISLQEGTTESRLIVWNMAWKGFKDHPVLGWGQGSFNYVFNKYYSPKLYNQEQWFDRTHDVFFDWLISGGLLGLLGYLSLFFAIIFYLLKDPNDNFSLTEKAVMIGLLTGYFIHNLFVFDQLISYLYFFSILGYIHTLSTKEIVAHKKIKEIVVVSLIPIIVIATIFTMYFVNWNAYSANRYLLKALISYRTANGEINIDKNLKYYKKALSYNSLGQQEIREQFTQIGIGLNRLNLDNKDKQKLANLIYEEMEKQIKADPDNARLEVLTGTFLASIGSYDMALTHLTRASELSPNKQQIIILLGNVLKMKGKNKEAFQLFKVAYELDKNFKKPAIDYAASAIRIGKYKLAQEILKSSFGTDLIYNPKIVRAYYKAKNYNKLITILELHKKEDPKDYQARVSLAATYNELGYKSKAITEIKEIMEVYPTFKKQGESFIKQIKQGKKS